MNEINLNDISNTDLLDMYYNILAYQRNEEVNDYKWDILLQKYQNDINKMIIDIYKECAIRWSKLIQSKIDIL